MRGGGLASHHHQAVYTVSLVEKSASLAAEPSARPGIDILERQLIVYAGPPSTFPPKQPVTTIKWPRSI